jgi:hypothetical protein
MEVDAAEQPAGALDEAELFEGEDGSSHRDAQIGGLGACVTPPAG